MTNRGYETSPRTAILMLMECAEDRLAAEGHDSFRREVTEMRVELADRLIGEVADTQTNRSDSGGDRDV